MLRLFQYGTTFTIKLSNSTPEFLDVHRLEDLEARMPYSEHPRDLVRFGDFELDPATGELKRAGSTIRLQPQPLKVLLALIRQPGELVSREQLKREVMPEALYGDADHAINLAVTKLRGALQDSSDKPEFIDTLPRRGYRFVADVHKASADGGEGRERLRAARRRGLHWLLAIVFAVSLIFVYVRHRSGSERFTVVVAVFTNGTNEPAFDSTLRQGLSAQLQHSPSLKLLSDERISQVLSLMMKPRDTRLTNGVALEVCQRTASAAVIYGSIAMLGKEYVLELKGVNCRTGDLLVHEQANAVSKEEVLRNLAEGTARLRERLEALTPTLKDGTAAAYVTTPSVEALHAYSVGLEAMLHGRDDSVAITLMQRAATLDPEFAMAYVQLGVLYRGTGQSSRAATEVTKAYSLRDRVSTREKLEIEARHEDFARGNMESARTKYSLWASLYPEDVAPLVSLGAIYRARGECNEAIEPLQKALGIAPQDGSVYAGLVDVELCRGRLDSARAFIREALDRGVDMPRTHISSYLISFLQHDEEGMQKEIAYFRGSSGWNAIMLCAEAKSAAFAGQFVELRSLVRRSADTALLSDQPEIAANCHADAAIWEALSGNGDEARKQVQAALLLANSRDVQGRSALALALSSDSKAADDLARDLGQRFQEDTSVQMYYLPAIRSANALADRNHPEVAEALPAMSECSFESTSFSYLRGKAYLENGNGTAAAVEFEKVLACPGTVGNDPMGALSRFELGRAYERVGNRKKARAAYGEFLRIWKDADSSATVGKARAEYSALDQNR